MQEDKITVCLISPFCNYHCEHFDPYPSNYMVYMLHTWASGIYYKEAPWNFGIVRNCSLSYTMHYPWEHHHWHITHVYVLWSWLIILLFHLWKRLTVDISKEASETCFIPHWLSTGETVYFLLIYSEQSFPRDSAAMAWWNLVETLWPMIWCVSPPCVLGFPYKGLESEGCEFPF